MDKTATYTTALQSFPPSGEREGGFYYLGTITHITDASGNVVNEYNFDAWGRRRNFTDWSYTVAAQTDLLPDRGFTGHEYLPWFKLYNMNGRLYDPVVGRFLEPDPVIQDAFSTQNLNRYSYCLNNPLKYVDPSGWLVNPGFNSNVWSMIENAWNNTQSNYDMFYSYDNGRLTGTSSLTYSGEGNTFWYSATVGEWYRDSNGNPTVKNGNSAGFLTEFYSMTLPVLSNNVLSKPQSENWNLAADISSLSGLILSGIDYAANSSAEYSFKYSSSGSAAAEEAASQTLKSISKGVRVLGHSANIVNALAGIYTFKYSKHRWGDYGKLGVSLSSAGLSVFAYTAPIGLTIGFIDIAGGFNGFYDYLDNQHEFYDTTGGVMLPINGIPNYLQLKK